MLSDIPGKLFHHSIFTSLVLRGIAIVVENGRGCTGTFHVGQERNDRYDYEDGRDRVRLIGDACNVVPEVDCGNYLDLVPYKRCRCVG